jgi:hypothetical protein
VCCVVDDKMRIFNNELNYESLNSSYEKRRYSMSLYDVELKLKMLKKGGENLKFLHESHVDNKNMQMISLSFC